MDAKSKGMRTGQEVEKHGYDLLVLNDTQAMSDMKAAEGNAEQVTIRDCMPEGERDATTSEEASQIANNAARPNICLLYTSPSPRDQRGSRMPSSA